MKAAPLGEESCLPDLSGEVILQNQLQFCLGEEEEIYEGYGRVKNAYPYRQRNRYTRELQEREGQPPVSTPMIRSTGSTLFFARNCASSFV